MLQVIGRGGSSRDVTAEHPACEATIRVKPSIGGRIAYGIETSGLGSESERDVSVRNQEPGLVRNQDVRLCKKLRVPVTVQPRDGPVPVRTELLSALIRISAICNLAPDSRH